MADSPGGGRTLADQADCGKLAISGAVVRRCGLRLTDTGTKGQVGGACAWVSVIRKAVRHGSGVRLRRDG